MSLLTMNSYAILPLRKPGWSGDTGSGNTPWGTKYATGGCNCTGLVPGSEVIMSLRAAPQGATRFVFRITPAVGNVIGVRYNTTGHFELMNSNTVVATAVAPHAPESWHRYELKALIADSGNAEFRVDGETLITYSGDLRSSASVITPMSLTFGDGNGNMYHTEAVAMDTVGSAPFNTFLGDFTINAYSPNGNGANSDFIGSDGNSTDNYLLVDERPFSNADYVSSGTPGAKDLYNVPDISSGASILAVQTTAYVQKSDSGERKIKFASRSSGGVVKTSAAQALAVAWNPQVSPVEYLDPNNDSWTPSRFNGAQFGVEVE